MAFAFQRDIDIKLALSSRKEITIGTALTDGLLDQAARMLTAAVPSLARTWRSDRAWIKGDEYAKTLDERARDVRWGPSFDMNSWLAAWAFCFALGKVSSALLETAVYQHTITATVPPTDSPVLPVTSISIKHTADLSKKYADLVVKSLTLSGGNSNDVLGLAVELIGSGFEAAGVATYPTLASPEVGPLFNRDMKIYLGTEGSPTEISDRIQEWSIALTNNFKEDLAYYPGSGLFRARFPHGSREATVTLGMFAKDVDDIRTLFDGTTSKEIKFLCAGALAGATQFHTFQARFPATRIVVLDPDSADEFRLWRLHVPPEGIFRGGTLTEPFEFKIINKEATFLATS